MTAMVTPAEVLSEISLFSMLSKRDIEKLLQDVHDRTFGPGTVLTEQDEYGTLFTVIVEGTASVTINGAPVRQLKGGDFFGEMALITRSPRSATCR